MSEPFDGYTLQQAKDWLRERLDGGERCPCCDQRAQTYRRQISGVTAATLIRAYSEYNIEPFHLPSFDGVRGGDFSKLAYWGLIVEERKIREDGGRAGWWAITTRGENFILGAQTIPNYAFVYDGRVMRHGGDFVTITDVLGTRFDYRELMGWTR